jgi:CheY-like chemotaxis protein
MANKKKNILLIDDEEDIALLIKEGLEIYGNYNVDTYTNPSKALDHLEPEKYDIILIDIVMPNISGMELYSLIQRKNRRAKICLFSAADYPQDDIKKMFPSENQDILFIQKPIKIKDLSNVIANIINGESD